MGAMGDAERGHFRLFAGLAASLALHGFVFGLMPGQFAAAPAAPTFPGQAASLSVDLRPPPAVLPTQPPLTGARAGATVPSPRAEATAGTDTREPVAAPPPAPQIQAAPSGLFPGPWYYPARYLHRRPSPLKPIRPEYPADAGAQAGHVVILLLIDEQGRVDQYRIRATEPEGVFDASVIAAFTAARYAPALIAGHAVKSQLLAEVTFTPGAPPQADFSIMEGAARPLQGSASSRGSEN